MFFFHLIILSTAIVCADPIAKSSSEQIPLLELFTSETCSSCPPADSWIGKLENHPKLWKSFVPIAFEVASRNDATERQKAHARAWVNGALYTPAFVLDGKEWGEWSSLSAPNAKPGARVGILSVHKNNAGFQVSFQPENKKGEDLTLNIALVGLGTQGKGRNHDFIVLDWQSKFILKPVDGAFRAQFPILKSKKHSVREAVVAWIQQGSAPRPIQATGAFIN